MTITQLPARAQEAALDAAVPVGGRENPPPVPRVVGLDLSLTSTGVAVADEVLRIRSTGHASDNTATRGRRLHTLRNRILQWCRGADLVVIEGPAFSRNNAGTHDRSGLWWMVVDRLIVNEIPFAVVSPTARAKYATGKGNANKDQVLVDVVRRFDPVYPIPAVMGTDEADALVLFAMGRDHLGFPVVAMPEAHRASLAKVEWPELVTA